VKRPATDLKPGDVIRTHPQRGYWGCAVVLDRIQVALAPTVKVDAALIAITNAVRLKPFELADLVPAEMKVLIFERHYQPTADGPVYKKREMSIAKYPIRKGNKAALVKVIGSLDPSRIYEGPRSGRIAKAPGEFPLMGSDINSFLGNEAAITWRRKYDKRASEAFDARQTALTFKREDERL
jgi:hypothetical protein